MWDSSHVDLTLNDYWRWGLSFCCCCCPVTQLCPTLCDPMNYSTPGFPVHHQLPELTQIHVHRVGYAIQPSHSLSSHFPPAFNLSQHQDLFRWVGSSHRWPKYWSFSISPSNEYSGLISFKIDWLDLLAVQGTLRSFLQHHSSKASILRHSDFFLVQLSHPYMTTGKTKSLTRQNIVGKVMSLLFNMPSRLVITFLPRSKCLLNSEKCSFYLTSSILHLYLLSSTQRTLILKVTRDDRVRIFHSFHLLFPTLDCKEIQPVHPKGNQSWIFIERTDAEAETPTL